MNKNILILILFGILFCFNLTFATSINVSPVVQVVSYNEIYGKYVQRLGWGSASIINNNGVIVTNNHVVDDGEGNIADIFNICISKKFGEKPICDYTATLIERNKTMDFAILKIDQQDIYANSVDYNDFKYIEIDFDYEPKTQDDVSAIGYPRIGADTITETKGIISGITKYNDFDYLKTDAKIAGGNSGGGLINKQGKLIGIPTFGIGGNSESMGYALYIKEAQEIVNKNINKTPQAKILNVDFLKYKTTIESINKQLAIKDLIFDISFNENYEIKNYVPNKQIQISPKKNDEFLVSSLNISLNQIPELKSKEELYYYLESIGFYYKSYHKLIEEKIGGLTFYRSIYSSDATGGENEAFRSYISQISPNLLIKISLNSNMQEDLELNNKVKEEIKNILNGINFTKENLNSIVFDYDLNAPKVKIKSISGAVYNDYMGKINFYFDNLHDIAAIGIMKQSIIGGKGKSVEELYENEGREMDSDYKSLIKFKGHKGYIFCTNETHETKDENGNYVSQNYCMIKIYEDLNDDEDEYYIYGILVTDKNKIRQNLDTFNSILEENLDIETIGDGETNLINVYESLVKLNFTDLGPQTEEYKKVLQKLIKYKLISNTKFFKPYTAVKWKEFVYLYTRYVYAYDYKALKKKCKNHLCLFVNYEIEIDGKSTNLHSILNEMKIPLEEYVDINKIDAFRTYLELKLAGVDLPLFNEERYYTYTFLIQDSQFQHIKKKVDDFNNKIYSDTKFGASETIGDYDYFFNRKRLLYVPGKGLIIKDLYNQGPYDFSSKNLETEEDPINSYEVLSKAQAIDFAIEYMDFALFDPELMKKKESVLDEYEQ